MKTSIVQIPKNTIIIQTTGDKANSTKREKEQDLVEMRAFCSTAFPCFSRNNGF
jgi:hypothetical protein